MQKGRTSSRCCASHMLKYAPRLAMRPSWLPSSTTLPSAMTTGELGGGQGGRSSTGINTTEINLPHTA